MGESEEKKHPFSPNEKGGELIDPLQSPPPAEVTDDMLSGGASAAAALERKALMKWLGISDRQLHKVLQSQINRAMDEEETCRDSTAAAKVVREYIEMALKHGMQKKGPVVAMQINNNIPQDPQEPQITLRRVNELDGQPGNTSPNNDVTPG
jgi:hypothetical protein